MLPAITGTDQRLDAVIGLLTDLRQQGADLLQAVRALGAPLPPAGRPTVSPDLTILTEPDHGPDADADGLTDLREPAAAAPVFRAESHRPSRRARR